mmetsp:Transcript_20380/g.28805  ORF Transcript_20380/g.28805 Transcript_20380/m.28805 type:complete len:97 (-) Transcript_20380:83-373(-)
MFLTRLPAKLSSTDDTSSPPSGSGSNSTAMPNVLRDASLRAIEEGIGLNADTLLTNKRAAKAGIREIFIFLCEFNEALNQGVDGSRYPDAENNELY